MWSTRGDRGGQLMYSNKGMLGAVQIERQRKPQFLGPASHLTGLRRERGGARHQQVPSAARSSSICRPLRDINGSSQRTDPQLESALSALDRKLVPKNPARAMLATSSSGVVEAAAAAQIESVIARLCPSRMLFLLRC